MWVFRVTEVFLYIKAYSFGGNEVGLRDKRSFELTDFELSRFHCISTLRVTLLFSVLTSLQSDGKKCLERYLALNLHLDSL